MSLSPTLTDSLRNRGITEEATRTGIARYGTSGDLAARIGQFLQDPAYSSLYIPSGSYAVSKFALTTALASNKDIVCARDAVLTVNADDSPFIFNPGVAWSETVTGITTETALLGVGATVASTYSVLQLSGNRSVRPGIDLLKVVSDEPLPAVLTAQNAGLRRRKGENAMVGAASDGSSIKLSRVLGDTYDITKNVKVVCYRKERITWRGGRIVCDPAMVAAAGATSAMFKTLMMVGVEISDVQYEQGRVPFTYFAGCFGHSVHDIRGRRLITDLSDAANNVFGYMINNISSEQGRFYNLDAWGARHVYTDNMNYSSEADDQFDRRGRSRNNLIEGINAFGCDNAAADTHEAGDGTTFLSTRTTGNFAGPSSGGLSSNSRGQNVTHRGHRSVGSYRGHLGQVVTGGYLDDCEYRRCQSRAIELTLPDDGVMANGATASKDNRWRKCLFETIGSGPVARIGDDNVNGWRVELDQADDIFFKLGNKENTTSVIDIGTTRSDASTPTARARIRGRNWTIDLSDYVATSSAGAVSLIRFITDGNDVEIDTLRIIEPADTSAFTSNGMLLANALNAGNTSRLVIRNIIFEGTKDFVGATLPGGNLFGLGSNLAGEVRVSGSKKVNATSTRTSYMNTTNAAINIGKIDDDQIVIRCSTSSAQTTTITPTSSNRDGQRVRFLNSGAGTQTVNGRALAQGVVADWIVVGGALLAA